MSHEAFGHGRREAVAVDGKGRSGGDTVGVGRRHDQRAERAHLRVEKTDRIILGIVGAEAVGADQFSQAVGVMSRSDVSGAAHLAEADFHAGLGELPGSFRSGETAADDMDLIGHGRVR